MTDFASVNAAILYAMTFTWAGLFLGAAFLGRRVRLTEDDGAKAVLRTVQRAFFVAGLTVIAGLLAAIAVHAFGGV